MREGGGKETKKRDREKGEKKGESAKKKISSAGDVSTGCHRQRHTFSCGLFCLAGAGGEGRVAGQGRAGHATGMGTQQRKGGRPSVSLTGSSHSAAPPPRPAPSGSSSTESECIW